VNNNDRNDTVMRAKQDDAQCLSLPFYPGDITEQFLTHALGTEEMRDALTQKGNGIT
jgi:hypothetical protein